MKKFLTIVLILTLLSGLCLETSAKSSGEEIITPQTQLEKREFQTRSYQGTNKTVIMKAMLNVLQDEGFIVNNANPLLGFISGTKDFSTSDKTIDISKEFGVSKAKLTLKGVRVATIANTIDAATANIATANVTEFGKEMKVRVNFKRKLLNQYGNAQQIEEITDANYYQDFYAKVDKAIFIQKQKI